MKFTALLTTALAVAAEAASVWPVPRVLKTGEDTVWLAPYVKVNYNLPRGTDSYTRNKIHKAWQRTREHLFKQNIVPWKFHPRHTDFEPAYTGEGQISEIVINVHELDPKRPTPVEQLREAYNLTIPCASGKTELLGHKGRKIFLDADSSAGVLHGLNTLSQLFYATAEHGAFGSVYSKTAPITIQDSPKYPHRGLNLDVARQWYDVDTIKRVITSISWNKFNVLHLHITDSQAWPLEIPALPELAQKGSYFKGLTYSPRDLQSILDHAESVGVTVNLEIDMPGHTTSIAEAYPDLIVGKNMQPDWDTYAAQPPSGSLKLNNPAVRDFLTTLLDDLLPRLKQHSPYFHSGGDEVNANVYALDPGVGSNRTTDIQPHLQEFVSHVASRIHAHGMTQIAWEEMFLDWNLTLPASTTVQSWISSESVKKIAQAGHKVIGGNYNFWYLDCGQGQWLDLQYSFYPFLDYCNPRKNWRLIYSYDPDQGLSAEERKMVVGGEAHVWSEQIDPESIDIMLWPRASAVGEILWSGRLDADGKNRTFADATPRLGEIRERMVARGVKASPITQTWCHQNRGGCEL